MTTHVAKAIVLALLTSCTHADVTATDEAVQGQDTDAKLDPSPFASVYTLTQYGADQYAVDLGGGVSELESGTTRFGLPKPEPKAVVRTVRGRVVDGEGRPVAGATVLGGPRVSLLHGNSMTASSGTATAADGSYTLPVTSAESVHVLALANDDAWSELARLPDGTTDEVRDLVVAAPARLEGTVTRGGAVVDATITLRSPGEGGLSMVFVSDENGAYTSPPLPPSAYELGFTRGAAFGPKIGYEDARAITLRRGAVDPIDVDLPVGISVTVDAEGLSGPRLQTLRFTLVPGPTTPDSADAVHAALKSDAARGLRSILQGGDNLHDARTFTDVAAGPYTMCVEARGARPHEGAPESTVTLDFECRTFTVDGSRGEQRISFALTAGD